MFICKIDYFISIDVGNFTTDYIYVDIQYAHWGSSHFINDMRWMIVTRTCKTRIISSFFIQQEFFCTNFLEFIVLFKPCTTKTWVIQTALVRLFGWDIFQMYKVKLKKPLRWLKWTIKLRKACVHQESSFNYRFKQLGHFLW